MSKRIWKYVWKNKKESRKKHYWIPGPVGKVHKMGRYDDFKCGSSRYEQWSDIRYKELPQEALDLGRKIFCRRCFPDLVIYQDMSLPDDLFRL